MVRPEYRRFKSCYHDSAVHTTGGQGDSGNRTCRGFESLRRYYRNDHNAVSWSARFRGREAFRVARGNIRANLEAGGHAGSTPVGSTGGSR